jgi:hypothetical protein
MNVTLEGPGDALLFGRVTYGKIQDHFEAAFAGMLMDLKAST